MNRLIFTNDIEGALLPLLGGREPFVVTDENVACKVELPGCLAQAGKAIIKAGEEHKNIASVSEVWEAMTRGRLTRRGSVVVNIGGGVVTDLGGFAAATFKRGVGAINIPTTLLGAVDASVGGKTGIDFCGLKNQVGVFAMPEAVIISAIPLQILPDKEYRSGLGEMLKHALLEGSEALVGFLDTDWQSTGPEALLGAIRGSVAVKERIVGADPEERGIRKALNLGHTIGHALEANGLSRGRGMTHGEAVARGLVAELVLSKLLAGFPSEPLYATARWVRSVYGAGLGATCEEHPALIALMANDKKNLTPGKPVFTLLTAPGSPQIDVEVAEDEIRASLDIATDLLQ